MALTLPIPALPSPWPPPPPPVCGNRAAASPCDAACRLALGGIGAGGGTCVALCCPPPPPVALCFCCRCAQLNPGAPVPVVSMGCAEFRCRCQPTGLLSWGGGFTAAAPRQSATAVRCTGRQLQYGHRMFSAAADEGTASGMEGGKLRAGVACG